MFRMFRPQKQLLTNCSKRYVSAWYQGTGATHMVDIHGIQRQCRYSATPKVACTEAALETIGAKHKEVAKRARRHLLVNRHNTPGIPLTLDRIYESHQNDFEHYMHILSSLCSLSAAEQATCVTISQEVETLLHEELKNLSTQHRQQQLIQAETEIITSLKKLRLDCPLVKLTSDSIPILGEKEYIDFRGVKINFKANRKLIGILNWQSPVSQSCAYTYDDDLPLDIFRVNKIGRPLGLHHTLVPVFPELVNRDAIHLRDVLRFYDEHLAVIPLQYEGIDFEKASCLELLEVCKKFEICFTQLKRGHHFTTSTGYDNRSSLACPEEILRYMRPEEYTLKFPIHHSFLYSTEKGGELRQIDVNFHADRVRLIPQLGMHKKGFSGPRKDFISGGWSAQETEPTDQNKTSLTR